MPKLIRSAPPCVAATIMAGGAHAAEEGGAQAAMPELVKRFAELATSGIEAAGVGVILLGIAIAAVGFLRDGFGEGGWEDAYERFRARLGRGILLGLELLVAADIIGTVAAPLDLSSIGALGLIVLIRTFLSFSLEVEISGRWPWQERPKRRPED